MALLIPLRTWIWSANYIGIDFASGTMIAMAADLRRGIFYRPLVDAHGYGGTRYAPLYFSLHAGLLTLGTPVLLGAYLLSTIAIIALLWGVFLLLRELGVARHLAAFGLLVLLSSDSVQTALCIPKSDGLAAALNVWGLVLAVRAANKQGKLYPAAMLFAAAWSAKITTIFGLAAVCVWLVATARQRLAWRLGAQTVCGYLLVACLTIFASHGRVVEIFRACASGGADNTYMAQAPLWLLAWALYSDASLALLALISLYVVFRQAWSHSISRHLESLFFVATLLVSIVIFGSPGTVNNHLLDLQIAAVVLIGCWLSRLTLPLQRVAGVCILGAATLASITAFAYDFNGYRKVAYPHDFRRVLRTAKSIDRPILSENPVIPVLAGQQAYVLDPWMLQLLRRRFPGIEEHLLDRLRTQYFGAVVLSHGDPYSDKGQRWYSETCFAPGFLSVLRENYRLATVIDSDWIFLPKGNVKPAK